MISTWKQELVGYAAGIFERGNKQAADPQQGIDNLHRKIGRLQVERDFLAGQPAIAGSAERRAMIAPGSVLCIARQAKLLGISRSSVY